VIFDTAAAGPVAVVAEADATERSTWNTRVPADLSAPGRPRKAEVMMRTLRKPNPRTEYRLRRMEQVNNSPTLAEKFAALKTLQVTVDYFDSSGVTRTGGMKYKVNLAHGKSLLNFNCVHPDCIGGDYDLSDQLAQAVAAKRKVVEGELRCQGTRRNKERKQEKPCESVMRYKLALGY
jgi:hypothetical protein